VEVWWGLLKSEEGYLRSQGRKGFRMDRYETIERLQRLGIVVRGSPTGRLYLGKVDLFGADLAGAYLSTADLTGADLGLADLSGAALVYAGLQGADLEGARLREADLRGANLREANLSQADLVGANLSMANLFCATLVKANLRWTNFHRADLRAANLREACLEVADLSQADLRGVDLRRADLRQANLYQARLTAANLEEANLRGCQVQGIFARDLHLAGAQQENLVITQEEEPVIAVDTLEIAQLLDLLLHENKYREVMPGIAANIVLIVGHFVPGQRGILETLRQGLRQRRYLPVLLDFEETCQSLTDRLSRLTSVARFVIVDLTSPAVLQEVPDLVESLRVPVVPLVRQGAGREPPVLEHLRRTHLSLLETCFYGDQAELLASLEEKVIVPAEEVARGLGRRRAKGRGEV